MTPLDRVWLVLGFIAVAYFCDRAADRRIEYETQRATQTMQTIDQSDSLLWSRNIIALYEVYVMHDTTPLCRGEKREDRRALKREVLKGVVAQDSIRGEE